MFILWDTNHKLTPSTGDNKELLPPSRTKDNADLAGLSLLLDLLKEPTSMPTNNCSLSLNSNWLIALNLSEMLDAMEDGWTLPSNTFNKTELPLKTNILIRDQPKNANPSLLPSKSQVLLMFLKTPLLKWLLP